MATIVGTLGNDTLTDLFNADDEIFGDALGTVNAAVGSDQIFGRGGADVVAGDATTIGPAGTGGDDTVQGGDGNDDIFGDARGSLLYGGAFADLLAGDAGDSAEGSSTCGDDRMQGRGGTDFLFGDAQFMFGTAAGGDDVLRGGAGDDLIVGDARTMGEFAAGGDDRIFGGGDDDELWGDGEPEDDTATGGRDRFFFAGGFGDDTVEDFRPEDDGDRLVFQGFAPDEFQITIDGDDTLLTSLGDDSVRLAGFTDPLTFGVDVIFAWAGGHGRRPAYRTRRTVTRLWPGRARDSSVAGWATPRRAAGSSRPRACRSRCLRG
jgi:Ca2+-binding RTX toxin-like protein